LLLSIIAKSEAFIVDRRRFFLEYKKLGFSCQSIRPRIDRRFSRKPFPKLTRRMTKNGSRRKVRVLEA
jgi:hypothetical protein